MPLLKRDGVQNGRYCNDFLKWCKVRENLMLQIALDFKMGVSVACFSHAESHNLTKPWESPVT